MSKRTSDRTIKFQSADEMVLSIVRPEGGEVRVAACSVSVEEKTKLIVEVAIVVIAFIVILAIGIDPYFIVIPITLVELVYFIYVLVMGGTDAIIVQENVHGPYWRGVYVIKGVSHDKQNQLFSYDSVYELQWDRIEKKWSLYPFGRFKFKHDDTTFTLVGTLSKNRQHHYTNGRASFEVDPKIRTGG